MTFILTLDVFCRAIYLYCKGIVMLLNTISQQSDYGGITFIMSIKKTQFELLFCFYEHDLKLDLEKTKTLRLNALDLGGIL